MANNYLQFSESLDVGDDEKKLWLEKFLERPAEDVDECTLRSWCAEHGVDAPAEAGYYPSFEYAFAGIISNKERVKVQKNPEYTPAPGAPWSLWMYTEESAYPEQVASMVAAFFRHFKIDSTFTLTWACTCSKMRVGEFSGGGFIVMPFGRGVKWSMPHQLFNKVHEQLKKLNAERLSGEKRGYKKARKK